jgi:hypothetical protein
MKYWKLFAHPYTFGKEDASYQQPDGAEKDSDRFIILAYLLGGYSDAFSLDNKIRYATRHADITVDRRSK